MTIDHTNSSLLWLEHLQKLFPFQGTVIVGAGSGSSPWIQYFQQTEAENITLIEADKLKSKHLQHRIKNIKNWKIENRLIGPGKEETLFYKASNSAESGLIQPENLQEFWPNLVTRETQTYQATPLSALLPDFPAQWLIVDCFPSLSILKTSSDTLKNVDVLIARVTLKSLSGADFFSSLPELQDYLSNHQLIHIATEVDAQPNLGYALFIRDFHAQINSLRQSNDIKSNELASALTITNEIKQNLELEVQKSQAILAEKEQIFSQEISSLQQTYNTETQKLKQDLKLETQKNQELLTLSSSKEQALQEKERALSQEILLLQKTHNIELEKLKATIEKLEQDLKLEVQKNQDILIQSSSKEQTLREKEKFLSQEILSLQKNHNIELQKLKITIETLEQDFKLEVQKNQDILNHSSSKEKMLQENINLLEGQLLFIKEVLKVREGMP